MTTWRRFRLLHGLQQEAPDRDVGRAAQVLWRERVTRLT